MVYIVAIAGVRPQYVKIAALQEEIKRYNNLSEDKIDFIAINAGQHYNAELSENIITELGVDFRYTLVHKKRYPIDILAQMIVGIYEILKELKPQPDWVVVFGDANPTLAGCIAASRLNLPIAHVEAGMKRDEFEHEEVNRKIADRLSKVNFCVSKDAVLTLRKEGISEQVFWTGDLAYDFMINFSRELPNGILGLKDYILSSIHRPQNLKDEILINLFDVFSVQSKKVVFLAHPRTQQRLSNLGIFSKNNVVVINPLDYKSTISAIKGCNYIITDSGGLIREAYHFEKRCLILRGSGAWSELVSLGYNKRITSEKKDILNSIGWVESKFNDHSQIYENVLYREDASRFALDILLNLLKA